jgi:succinyl-CoA synthetase alpha subunit
MCHVIVASDPKTTGKKEFQKKKILEIKRKKPSPIVMFIYGRTKKTEKAMEKYKKKHPRVEIMDERSVA